MKGMDVFGLPLSLSHAYAQRNVGGQLVAYRRVKHANKQHNNPPTTNNSAPVKHVRGSRL